MTFTYSPIWDTNVDQVLDELEVGPLLTLGRHEFTLECDGPDFRKVPDPTGPTALLVSFAYKGSEFYHLGLNVEVHCTAAELPEVFTDDSILERKIGRGFMRASRIPWDSDHHVEDDSEDVLTTLSGHVDLRSSVVTGAIDNGSRDASSDDDDALDIEREALEPVKKAHRAEPLLLENTGQSL